MTLLYSTTSGFWPMFSPDGRYVLAGNGFLKLIDLQTKTEKPIARELKGFLRGGWLNARTILIQHDDATFKGDGFLYAYDVPTGALTLYRNDGNYRGGLFRASGGHWCVVQYHAGLCLDGVWLGPGYNYTDLSEQLCVSNWGTPSRVRLIDTTTRVVTDVVPKVGPNVVRASRDYVAYGYFGPSALRLPDTTQGFVNITGGEGPCKVVFGPLGVKWVVTGAEINGTAYMLARPLGHAQPTAVIFPHAGNQVDAVAVMGNTFRVAGDQTNGHLAIYEASFNDPLTALPVPPPPVKPPVEPPVVARPKITITSYLASGPAPLTSTATWAKEAGSGPITKLSFLSRPLGDSLWDNLTPNGHPLTDPTYDYVFPRSGTYEIGLRAEGPGGMGQTGKQRLVTVSSPEPPIDPPPTTEPPIMQPIAQYPEFVHREIPMVAAAFRAKHGQRPNDPDFAHNAWRLLSEGWTPEDAVADITNPPAGGHGKRQSFPTPVMPYDQFVHTDYPSIINTYRSYYGHEPGDIDYAHLAWRPLAERWTVRDVIHDIKGEPLEDGGHGGAIPPGNLPPPVGTWDGSLGVSGRVMTRGGQIFRPVGISGFVLLKLIVDGKRQQAEDYLGFMLAHRFNFARVLVTGKGWNELKPQAAIAALPDFLAWLKSHGVGAELTTITGSKLFADQDKFTNWEPVVREVGRIGHAAGNATLEAANEFYHGSQSGAIHDTANLRRWCKGLALPWAVGAAKEDEPLEDGYDGAGGSYCTAHLDRGRDYWNQVRRIREIYAIASRHNVPSWDNERIGAADFYQSSRRMNDPVFFLTAGLLDRCFDTPAIHHTNAGLECTIPGGVETLCADAFVRGLTGIVPADWGVLQYQNSGHTSQGSPVASFDGATRCYSFIQGGRGVTCVLGGTNATKIQWANSFQPVETLCDEHATGPESGRTRLIVHRIEKR